MKHVRRLTYWYLSALTVAECGAAIWGAVRHHESEVMTSGSIMLVSGLLALVYRRWMRKDQ